MKNSMPFDCEGKDGEYNFQAFKELPSVLRLVIRQTQQKIQESIETSNPGRLVKATSGFRAYQTNERWGGKKNSLHLFGFARDFKIDLGEDKPLTVPEFLECFLSKGCWHVQYRRDV